jgi:hypothetical protein
MATERFRSPDQQGYRLLLDKELPRGIQAHLVMLDMVIDVDGSMQRQPVSTKHILSKGQKQSYSYCISSWKNLWSRREGSDKPEGICC